MITLSDSAKACLDRYLQQIRAYLRGCKTVDPDEVERNIVEHIESEFEGATWTVSLEELNGVLRKLGSPKQWIPEEEMPWWKELILRLRTGPEDWRLAYLSFGLLVLGLVILPACIPLIAASFIVARAALSEAVDSHELKSQRWLIYPSLIIVYLFLLFSLLGGPALFLAAMASEWERDIRSTYPQCADVLNYYMIAVSFMLAVSGLWWTVLGGLLLKWWSLLHLLFEPFGGWFTRKSAFIFTLLGLGIMVAFSVFALVCLV